MQSWDIITGKLYFEEQLFDENFSEYERFTNKKNRMNFTNSMNKPYELLVSKESYDNNVDESMLAQYFDRESLEPKFKGQKVYYDVRYRAKQFSLH
jgi:hypothetical protein